MSKRSLIVFGLLVIGSLALSACGGGAVECDDAIGCVDVAAGDPIRIASALVISGANAQLGLDSQYGVEIAIEMYGDVAGHAVELQAEDDGCNAEGGQAAGQKIVSDPSIVAAIGTSCSGAGVPMSKVISDAGYAMVSPSNTAISLTDPDQAWNPGYYRTAHNDKVQGAVMAEYAYDVLGARTAAAIHDGDPYTEGLANAFRVNFEALGGSVVAFTAVNVGDTDMRPVLTSIAASEGGAPDFMFTPVFTAECAFLAVQALEVAGLEDTIRSAADGCFSADAAAAIGAAETGMIISGPDLSFSNALYDDFLALYQTNYGSAPLSVFHAHAFDATNLVLSCVAEIAQEGGDGSLSIGRQALRDCLSATSNYAGITGSLTCNQYGDCADPAIAMHKIEGGEYIKIWP